MSQPDTNRDLPPASAWLVESLRLTAFPEPGRQIEYAKWWRELVGSDSEAVNSQSKLGLYQERGKLDDTSVLALQVQGGRVDWFLLPTDASEPGPHFATIGDFPQTLEQFSALMRRWFPSSPLLSRFALAGVLLQPQPDRVAGYIQLSKYVPAVRISTSSFDFLYQINRPRQIEGLHINRLTRWSVALHRRVSIAAGAAAVTVLDIDRESACRLEFDINTPAEFPQALTPDRLETLLSTFVWLAREIASEGDVD
jgi:hypothetical protein